MNGVLLMENYWSFIMLHCYVIDRHLFGYYRLYGVIEMNVQSFGVSLGFVIHEY